MVLVDAYIKFPDVVKMTNTTAKATVNTLRDIFSRHGLLVSDNAPQSASKEYETFFLKMAYCIVPRQPINPPLTDRLSVLSKF